MKAEIRPFEPSDLAGVDNLRAAVYPEYPEAADAEFHHLAYRWMQSHPLAAGGNMHRWVVADGYRIVGHLLALPQYYRVGGQRVIAHTPADYMVLPQYGFQALGIMRRFFRTVENCVACDLPQEPIIVETRLGAKKITKLEYAAKILDVSQLTRLPSFVPPQAARLATRGLRGIDWALGKAFGGSHKVEVLEGFDDSFEAFFEEVVAAMPCTVEKDTAFLGWRYGPEAPLWPVRILGVKSEGRLLGYSVLRAMKTGDGVLLDLTNLPGRQDVAQSLVRESVYHLARMGSYIIRYRFIESPTSVRKKDLKPLGFFFRDKRRHTLLAKFADQRLARLAENPANWSYSIGDGEAGFWVG
jgi:hypothetical protein